MCVWTMDMSPLVRYNNIKDYAFSIVVSMIQIRCWSASPMLNRVTDYCGIYYLVLFLDPNQMLVRESMLNRVTDHRE